MIYIITTYIIILCYGKYNFLKAAMLQKCPETLKEFPFVAGMP